MKRIFTPSVSISVTQVRNFILLLSVSLIAWVSHAQQATNINFQAVPGAPTSISINWNNGTGVGRIVVVKNSIGTFKPTDNANISTLNANPNFTAGTNDQDGSGSGVAAVVFAGTGSGPVTVTNLSSGSTYFVQVYEFTDAAASPDYILTTNTSNPKGFVFYTTSGTFTVPVGVSAATVQTWGGGGGAGGNTGSGSGSLNGGGGGAYASSALTSLSGDYPVVVGSGGAGSGAVDGNGDPGNNSSFGTTLVIAAGGTGGGPGNQEGGTGGTVAASTGTTEFAGGNGGQRTTGGSNGGGGGGGSAGTAGNGGPGGNATTVTGGSAGNAGSGGGATGGAGGNNGAAGNNGNFPGGGAGGRGSSSLAAGNGASGLVIVSFNDNTAPVVSSISRLTPATSPTNATSVTLRVTFNENVSNVDAADFAVTGPGTPVIGTVTANSAVQYDVQVTGISGNGTIDLNFAGGQNIVDVSNNAFAGTINSEETYVIDNAGPVLSLAVLQSPTTGTAKINDVITFRVTADAAGYVAGTSTINSQAFSGSFTDNGDNTYDLTYTVVNGHADWAAGALQFSIQLNDALGNPSNAITAFTTANTLAGDANRPTISISAPSASFARNADTRTYTVTYTGETSISLVAGNITLNSTDGANANVALNVAGSVATVTLTNFTGNGTVGISIAAGTASDAAGNIAEAAGPSATITVDNLQPTVVLSSTDADGYVRSAQANVTITATFTEANGLSGTPTISIPTSATPVVNANMTGGSLIWTYSWNTPTGNEGPITVSISASDNAGNANAAPTGQTTFTIDNTAPTAVTINQAPGQNDPAYTGPVNFTVVFTNGPIDPATFTGGDFGVSGGTATYSMGTPTTSDNITWNVAATVTAADDGFSGTVIPTLNLNTVSDLAGNTSGSIASTSTDGTVEFVLEPSASGTIAVTTSPTQTSLTITRTGGNGERFLLVGRQGAAVNFTPVDGVDYGSFGGLNFFAGTAVDGNGNKILADAPVGTTTYNITGLAGGVTYHFAIFGYNRGSQSTYNNFRTTAGTVSSTTTACSFPSAPTSLTSSSNNTTVTLNWLRTTNNDFTLILFRADDGSAITAPVNGANFGSIDNANFGSAGTYGNAKVVLADETHPPNLTQSRIISNLAPGTTYAFAIYTYDPTTFCYQATGLTGTIATTISSSPELTVTAGALAEPGTISSMGTALSSAVLPQTNAVANFDFTVTDADGNGEENDADGADGLISQIIIYQGPNNSPLLSDWTQAIASAQLSDGINTQTSNITINPTNITIASIPTGPGNLGRINNDESKTFTLTIALKTALGGSLPSSIDGEQFDFNVTTNVTSSFTLESGSTFPTGQSVSSGLNKNVVDVVAEKIIVVSQPSSSALYEVPLAVQPVFRALDSNNNYDLGFNNALTVSTGNPDNISSASALSNFSNGVADFSTSGFRFTGVGTSTMAVSTTSPNITSANTNSITVTASTSLNAATSSLATDPLFNSDEDKVVLGFRLQTTGSPLNLTSVTFNSSVPVTDMVKNFELYSNSSDNFTGATFEASSASLTFSGLTVPLNSTPKYFFLVCDVEAGFPHDTPTIQFSLPVANFSVIGSKTGATVTGPIYNLIDNTAPFIQDINNVDSYLNAWSAIDHVATPSYHSNQVSFILTFNEPVLNVNSSKIITVPGTTSASGFPPVVGNFNIASLVPVDNTGEPSVSPSRYWKLTYDIAAGATGFIYPQYQNNSIGGFVQDAVGNSETTTANFVGISGDYYFYLTLPKPTNNPGFTTSTATNSSVTLNWNHNHGAQRATDYYIRAKESTIASFPAPYNIVNGVLALTDNNAFDNGIISQHVTSNGFVLGTPSQSLVISGLKSGVSYDFEIYPYTKSPNVSFNTSIEYKSDVTTTTTFATTTASASMLLFSSASSSISSLIDENPVQSQGVFSFTISDDSDGTDNDDAPFKFSSVTINQGTGNDIPVWTDVIAGATLADGTANPDIIGVVAGNTISFTGLGSANPGDFGYIADNNSKTYTLKIWLKEALAGTYPSTIDGLNLAFSATLISANYNNGNNRLSSKLGTINTAQSGETNNAVDVTASKLVFNTPGATPTNTNPQIVTGSIGVATPFSASAEQDPIVYALDDNGNLDLGYTNAAEITNTQELGQSVGSMNFVAGQLALNPFYFTTAGTNTKIVVAGTDAPAVMSATSSNVTAVISNTTTISDATAPALELASFTSLTNSLPVAHNFDFTITDDVGADAANFTNNDGLPTLIQSVTITQSTNNGTNGGGDVATFDNWTLSIAGAQLTDGISSVTILNPGTGITASSLVFNVAGTSMETVADNGSKTYQLRIWLRNPVDAALQDIIDNKDFAFSINQSNLSLGSVNTTSTLANSSTSTGDGRNVVTVTATKLDFITQWAALATQNYDAALSPNSTAKARDANQNLDTDYNTAALVTAFDSNLADAKTYPLVNSTVTVANGLITFNAGLQVSSLGNGVHNDVSRLVLTSGSLTTGNSNSFTLTYSENSDIVRDGTFVHPTDIQFINNREALDLTVANSVALDRFLLRDGGTSNDADGTKTKLQSISLNLTNHLNIRRIGLYDENGTEIQERDSTAFSPTGDITFSTFINPFEANDNDRTTKKLTVRVSFRAFVTDNQQINVSVTGATAANVSSQLTSISIPGDNLGTDKNKIEVVATKIDFTTVPTGASISVPLSPQVVVSARDVFANLDLDYNGTISATGTAPSSPTFSTINNPSSISPSGDFTGGTFTYPANFQFDVGDGNVQLTINAGAGSGANNVNAGAISGISPTISVLSSFESTLTSLYGPTYLQDINYINYQAANITGAADGFTLDYLQLKDGGADLSDIDGAPTTLDDLTLGISNPQSVQKIAIYTYDPITSAVTEIQEQANAAIAVTNGYGQITFNNLNITAPDNQYMNIWVLATFNNSASAIRDRDTIQVSILAATLGTGSRFAPDAAETGTIGGVSVTSVPFPLAAGSIQAGSIGAVNKLEVIATSLDFVTQPNDFAGINQPIDATTATSLPYTAIVHARDKFAVVDLDFNYTPSVIASANPVTSATFINGVLDLTGMQYNNAGAGKLTVQTSDPNNLNSNNTPWGTSIPCEPVDVINVTAVENTNGVLTTPNLKGGNVNQIIFGFTLNAQHFTASEPKLTGFSITFKDDNGNPYFYKTSSSTILKNFKILESTQGTAAGATSIAGIATITQARSAQAISLYGPSATSFDMVTVVFTPSSNYRTLFDPANPLTYYLQVDVDVSTNIGTPPITPYLEDNGYSDIFTRDNVLLTEGSSQITPVVKGPTRSFASTKPPALVSSDPFNGQLNVDPAQNTITLFFDVPVTTFDGKAFLYDRYSNNLVATLTATNGIYQWAPGQPTSPSPYITNPLTFELPAGFDLIPDSVYYLTINQGRFDPNNPVDRAGISDDGFNLFGGISFNGTLYFKAASPNPPVMKGTDPLKYYFSKTTTTINASFNQRGTAHFMITNMGATAPDIAQIKGAAYSGGTVYGRGSFDITQIEPSYQYGTVNTSLTPGVMYDVFMFAENDALPQPIGTAAPYGSSGNGFVAGTTGPTLRFTAPSATASLTNFPRYQVCSNSYTQLSDPIVISEVTNQQFTGTGIQSINILLPTGFQFDVNAQPSIQFNGTDFNNAILGSTPAYTFINTTILRISFGNNGATNSFDNIIISDLVVIANTPDITGFITRFSGNAIPALSDGAQFAQITSAADDPINFTNSYSIVSDFNLAPINIANTVTYIPDNYIDVTLNQSATRLFPLPPSGDYGPTFFSGSGLTNDILNLTAVPLNTGFNITLTHIDMNGCVSTKSDQYTVYNHKNAIAALGTPSTLTGERQVCIKNQSFPSVSTNQVIVSDSVSADGLAGYKLLELFANIPTKATPGTQIMTYGSAWQALVQQIPVVYSAKPDANTGQTYRTYNWDYKPILNAGTLPGGLPNPYSFFVQPPTPLGKTYYKGGSLGIIEFTGKYHSKADFSVFIPVRQEVEVFIPAIPVVEQVTAPSSTTSSGTLIYCEGIGSASDILINGYPAASPGSSTGIFTLLDSANLTPVDITVGSTVANGFTDNGNGTSSLKSSVTNNYRTIRVNYTYQDIGSPCSATGSFYIRITPNPRASFAATSVLTSANPINIGRPSAVNAYCENNLIQFNNTSTFPASGYVANTNPQWTLGDPLSATNTQLTPSALFIYNTNGRYIVTFSVSSQYNCPSQVVSDSIYIGAIPNVSFSMNGISTATPVNVVDNSTVADGPGTDSEIFSAQWKYSPSSAYTTATNNTFTTPGHYTITLLSTTQITRTDQAGASSLPGCERTFERPIIIVPAVSVLGGIEVVDDFESADPLTQWQSSSTNSLVSSWEKGDASESSSIELTSNVWATGLSTPYNPGEISFLYSPAYDLSNLVRPKVSFDYAAFMGVNDGVVLEFSTDTFNIADPLKEWFRIGTNADGNNWYNRSGLASKPGTQKNVVTGIISGDYGWSAQLDTVLHSQHTLSPDIPAGKRTHVIFRFALASLSGSANQGFAFDNFRVGERTRIVLVENFTNKGNAHSLNSFNVEKRESDFLRDNFTGIGTDVVKINYHVGFPNLDPFNDDYPTDPSARALFYNINETPLARMDGGKSNDPQKKYISDWGIAEYNIRTLKLSQADLQITPPVISANGGYEFSVTVTANDPLSKDTTILHVAFVEASIPLSSLTVNDQGMVKTGESSFEYVLKKMVPSALGTRFGSALQTGQSRTFGPFEWTPDLEKLYHAPNDLAIVVFLQNEFTKEIYQAEILTSLTDPALVTDVEDPDYARKIQLFPNPANNEVNIQLPVAVTKSTAVEMFDTYGKSVYQSTFNVGEQIKTVSTSELTGGVYFIQLNTPDGNIARRKIMVIHR